MYWIRMGWGGLDGFDPRIADLYGWDTRPRIPLPSRELADVLEVNSRERVHRVWRLCGMGPVVALVSKQRTQVLWAALRVSIQPETIFHKTGRGFLDWFLALDVSRICARVR